MNKKELKELKNKPQFCRKFIENKYSKKLVLITFIYVIFYNFYLCLIIFLDLNLFWDM
jgi:hypothetical protein